MSSCYKVFRFLVWVYGQAVYAWNGFWNPVTNTNMPHNRYFLSDDDEFDESYTRVPEDAVYIEEWICDNKKRCVVRYEGQEIPTEWPVSPFTQAPKCPWIWVGDRDSEIDLTRTFNKFLVVGNVINLDLVLKLIQVTEKTNLVYVDSETFEEHKFPGEGIVIHAA